MYFFCYILDNIWSIVDKVLDKIIYVCYIVIISEIHQISTKPQNKRKYAEKKQGELIMTKKIGLSLSFCVSEICEGSVRLEDVAKVITSTALTSSQEWDDAMQCYRDSYWRKYPDQGEAVAKELLATFRLEQPRLSEDHRGPFVGRVHWVDAENEIEWISYPAKRH